MIYPIADIAGVWVYYVANRVCGVVHLVCNVANPACGIVSPVCNVVTLAGDVVNLVFDAANLACDVASQVYGVENQGPADLKYLSHSSSGAHLRSCLDTPQQVRFS